MGYKSEAELEERLLQKIVSLGYERINVPDYDALLENFRQQLNRFNQKVLEHKLAEPLNLPGKTNIFKIQISYGLNMEMR